MSTSKQDNSVYCPDGYAYRVKDGHYIRCESFDEFHADLYHGKTRTDLYITSAASAGITSVTNSLNVIGAKNGK